MDYPFDTVGLTSAQIDLFYKVQRALRSKFRLELTGFIDFHLEDFEAFRHYDEISVRDSYVIKNTFSDCYILLVDTYQKARFTKGAGFADHRGYQVWALAYLKKDFGRVMIRPETLTDKIIELIHPIELDFEEDKAFSDTFYVLVNDRQKAAMAIDRSFRNVVMDVREQDFVIEVINHRLIIGSRNTITPENAIHMAEFVVRVCSSC